MTTKIATPLSRKAVLVAVNISQWTARKLDKKVTEETNERYHATEDAGRYNKLLIAGEHLKEMTTLVSAARDLHYTMTHPWTDKGPRILPNALFAKFSDEFRVIKRQFHDAADRFAAVYPALIEERKGKLNGMFNDDDYPSPDAIRSKFKLDIQVMPFPDVDDFRSDLDEETVAEIKAQLQTTTAAVLDNAVKSTVERIVDHVGHMAKKLGEFDPSDRKKSTFRDSLVENVRELAALLPALNITNDPRLDDIAERIQRELCVEDAEDLRDNDHAREAVQKSADDIIAAVSGIFG